MPVLRAWPGLLCAAAVLVAADVDSTDQSSVDLRTVETPEVRAPGAAARRGPASAPRRDGEEPSELQGAPLTPEQDHFRKYMRDYLPAEDDAYTEPWVGANASWTAYMRQFGGAAANYTDFIETFGGPKANYNTYVAQYSSMAGKHPASGGDWQQKRQEQLTAWNASMQSTLHSYGVSPGQSWAERAISSRAAAGGGGPGEGDGDFAKDYKDLGGTGGGYWQPSASQNGVGGSVTSAGFGWGVDGSPRDSVRRSDAEAGPSGVEAAGQGREEPGRGGYSWYEGRDFAGNEPGSAGFDYLAYMRAYAMQTAPWLAAEDEPAAAPAPRLPPSGGRAADDVDAVSNSVAPPARAAPPPSGPSPHSRREAAPPAAAAPAAQVSAAQHPTAQSPRVQADKARGLVRAATPRSAHAVTFLSRPQKEKVHHSIFPVLLGLGAGTAFLSFFVAIWRTRRHSAGPVAMPEILLG